jgi:hypothetical protein
MKRILAIAFILALAGGYYWFMYHRDTSSPEPVATEVAPQRWQVSTSQQPAADPLQTRLTPRQQSMARTTTPPIRAMPQGRSFQPTTSCATSSWRT